MKASFILAATLILAGCGKFESNNADASEMLPSACTYESGTANNTDAALVPYVRAFYQEAAAHGVTTCHFVTKINFGYGLLEGDSSVVGLCFIPGRIEILASYFDQASEIERQTLVDHELGHCALGLEHAPDGSLNIMNPDVLEPEVAQANWPLLLDKLFAKNLSLTE